MQLQYMSSSRLLNYVTVYRDCPINCKALMSFHCSCSFSLFLKIGDHLYLVLQVMIKPTTEFAKLIIHVTKAVRFTRSFYTPRYHN